MHFTDVVIIRYILQLLYEPHTLFQYAINENIT